MLKKRLFSLILLTLIVTSLAAQSIGPLTMEIASYQKVIKSKGDLKFIIRLKNVSSDSIRVPFQYLVVPKSNTEGCITYEVRFTGKDTFNVTNSGNVQVGDELLYKRMVSLLPGQSILAEANIWPAFFTRKGSYLIKFNLKNSCVNDLPNMDISTDWIAVKIETLFYNR